MWVNVISFIWYYFLTLYSFNIITQYGMATWYIMKKVRNDQSSLQNLMTAMQLQFMNLALLRLLQKLRVIS